MKIEISFWEKLSARIALLFVIAIFATFIPDYLHSFFGDWYCQGSGAPIEYHYVTHYANCNYADSGFHSATWHWGYRHWLWATMCLLLFTVNAIRIIQFINNKPKAQ